MKQNYPYFHFHFLSVEVLGKQGYFQTPKFAAELDTPNVAIQTPVRIRHYVTSCKSTHSSPSGHRNSIGDGPARAVAAFPSQRAQPLHSSLWDP